MSDIVVEANRTAVLDFGPITRRSSVTGLPIAVDLSLAGTKLWFTAKAAKTDSYANAKIALSYVTGGATDGFVVSKPSSTDDPNGTITIPKEQLVESAYWYWDLTLEEPDGRRTTVDEGAFKILLPVTDAA